MLISLLTILVVLRAGAQMTKEPAIKQLPPQLSEVGIEQRLSQQLPLSLPFRDEAGDTVTLEQYFHHGRPVILNLVYYECPMLCTEALNGLASTLRVLKFDVGANLTCSP